MYSPVIEVEAICKKVLKNMAMDIFFIVMNEKELSKKEIYARYKESTGDRSPSSQKARFKIDEALAMLEGAMLIDSWREGTFKRYFLTSYGEEARKILFVMFEKDPGILRGTKIVSKVALAGSD